ncbi:MAG: L,D-transpeptidase, partial [Opitutales bacterium]|nr:L,D-transpeptidase [Opitutales bacterium]
FKGRVSIGKRYHQLSAEEQRPNLITTRILWLEGLEPGINQGDNCDSYQRYIYFHGTNHEDKIGQPSSGGCIQLLNQEMTELFDLIEIGDHVFIE